MSQVKNTRGYVKDTTRYSELQAKAEKVGLSLRESGELDFQRNAHTKKKEEAA